MFFKIFIHESSLEVLYCLTHNDIIENNIADGVSYWLEKLSEN